MSRRPTRLRRLLRHLRSPARPPEPRRPSRSYMVIARTELAARDGLICQQCGCWLNLRAGTLAGNYPHVHHIVAWSKAKYLWWVNELWNLCLLCRRCNLAIGDRATPRLNALGYRLRAAAQAQAAAR